MGIDAEALIFGFDIAADGTASPLASHQVDGIVGRSGWRWLHLDRTALGTNDWINETSGLPEIGAEALLEEHTRPRVALIDGGALIILRGVNLNPGAEPGDMVSLRLWADAHSIVSLRKQKIFAIQALRDAAEENRAPGSVASFIVGLAEGLTDRLGDRIGEMEERVDACEEEGFEERVDPRLRKRLVTLRREIASYRRFLAPQRDALAKLAALPVEWLDLDARAEIRESLEALSGIMEMLDSIRERASIVQETVANRIGERMNRTMYALSMVTAIFLPLGFLTGLLGINVGGIPGAESHWGFGIVCAAVIILIAVQLFIFRRMNWL